jgi:predicted alpha/beta superfamily hydrolase
MVVALFSAACGAKNAATVDSTGPGGHDAGAIDAPRVDSSASAADSPSVVADSFVRATEAKRLMQPDAGDAGVSPAATVINIHYDTGFGHSIALRGSGGPLNWTTGVPTTNIAANEWTITLNLVVPVEVKPLFDDSTWAIGPNWTAMPGQTLDIWPFFFNTNGTVQQWGTWTSTLLADSRTVWEYLPPSYSENASERYPVVYMHDGQNLFYDSLSTVTGIAWNAQGAMDAGANDGSIHEAIIVGIENDGTDRINEYTPIADPTYGGGQGATYLNAIITELKPQIDATLRTETGADQTIMIGSSLGGLITSYAGLTHPDVFGRLGIMSPSTWWDSDWLVGQVTASAGRLQPTRVYVDCGDTGDDQADTTMLVQAYTTVGDHPDFVVQPGAMHGEQWWRERLPGALQYLLGPR